MPLTRSRASLGGLVGLAAAATGAGALLGMAGWPQPRRTVEFCGLILAAMLTSAFASRSTSKGWAVTPPSFVVDFTALLLLGPHATLVVAAAGMAARRWTDRRRAAIRPALFDAASTLVAIQTAGQIHRMLGGSMGHFSWPAQGAPIAAAVIAYCVTKGSFAEIVGPLCGRRPVAPTWATNILGGCPGYVLGATLSVGFVELIDHRMWAVLPVVTVPAYFTYRAYCAHLRRLEEEHRRAEVLEALDQGMAVLDSDCRIVLWNDTLERILGCPRNRALARPLVRAVPALAGTALPPAIADVLAGSGPRTVAVGFAFPTGARVLQVKILPVDGGVTLIWQDVTVRVQMERSLKRSEERLALAAEGANDGLWEWNLRTRQVYFSARWREMVGLPEAAGIGHPDEWKERVHADDRVSLEAALDAHLKGDGEYFEHEHRMRHEDGTYRQFRSRGIAVRDANGRATRIAGSLTDTTEWAIARSRLDSAGFVDPLTGLCNRAVFVGRLGQRLAQFKERRGSLFAVLYLDLDRFKIVNDSLGHMVGDQLLTAVSRRLESCIRPADTLARLGGDEFAILLNEFSQENQANAISMRIQEALAASFSIGGREVFTSASIGIAIGKSLYETPDEIMRDADTAMYHAKASGKARHELFDADMHARALDRLGFENDLRHAVSLRNFDIHYQPIVCLATGMCVGFEALVRWSRGDKPVSPAAFIPIAEEIGLIEPLGTWVLQQACATFAGWQRRFPDSHLDFVTVNVSSRQLAQQNFLRVVEHAVQEAGLQPSSLRLEITETALMENPKDVARLLEQLRDFGVKIYLDDFGTGYSSLSHLHNLPVDALKIDRSFVTSLLLPDRPSIVESILALARTLNTSVVAEGIEGELQARELERLGCTHAQGYLFSRPLTAKNAEELLASNQPLGPKGPKPHPAQSTRNQPLPKPAQPFVEADYMARACR